jgi:hypothetical protein
VSELPQCIIAEPRNYVAVIKLTLQAGRTVINPGLVLEGRDRARRPVVKAAVETGKIPDGIQIYTPGQTGSAQLGRIILGIRAEMVGTVRSAAH